MRKLVFEKIFLDTVGPLPESHSNNKYVLTIQDDLTKCLQVVPIPDKKKADTVARVLVEQFFLKFKFPKVIMSDCG